MSNQKDIGASVKVVALASPQNSDGTTINGAGYDRSGELSCVAHLRCGAATGTPTSYTADLKLQHSDDNGVSDAWADLSGAAVTQLDTDDTESSVNVNLLGAKAYVRGVIEVAFVGGTSPELPVAATLAVGGSDVKPIS